MAAATGTALTPVVGSPIFQHPFQTPSPGALQQQYPTPSPFGSISAASTGGLSSKFVVHRYPDLLLRSLAFLLAFVSAVALTATPSSGENFSFLNHSEFRYNISAAIIASIYSALQLFKGIGDKAFKGFFISDKTSDYITFILDQMMTYILLSSSSVSVLATERIPREASKSAAVISVCMLFAAFVVIAVSTLMSGYKLCKRIGW